MYTEEMLAAMDADTLERAIFDCLSPSLSRYTDTGSIEEIAYRTTHNLEMAFRLFTVFKMTADVEYYLFSGTRRSSPDSGEVKVNGCGLFAFDHLGEDDALAVCRAFLYAYHNQEQGD